MAMIEQNPDGVLVLNTLFLPLIDASFWVHRALKRQFYQKEGNREVSEKAGRSSEGDNREIKRKTKYKERKKEKARVFDGQNRK